ncbi:MAG: hypothetical protein ACTSVI_05530 [Promethearchaeota archaeon]
MLEKDEYELLATQNENLIREFIDYLRKTRKLKDKTVQTHLENLHVYANYFLLEYFGSPLHDFLPNDLCIFLGNWCPKNIMCHDKKIIRSYLTTFKKFNSFLHEKYLVDDGIWNEIKKICSNPLPFYLSLDNYLNLSKNKNYNVDSYIDWEKHCNLLYKDIMSGKFDTMDAGLAMQKTGIKLPEYLVGLRDKIKLTRKAAVFAEDFNKLVDYCIDNDNLSLTKNRSFFKRKQVQAMNALLQEPEALSRNANQYNSSFIHLFYWVSKTLGIFTVTKKARMHVTPIARSFHRLPEKERFLIIFDALWNKISWGDYYFPLMAGCREWRLPDRKRAAVALCAINRDFLLYHDAVRSNHGKLKDKNRDSTSLLLSLNAFIKIGFFPERIIPALHVMDLVQYIREDPSSRMQGDRGLSVRNINVTPLGEKILGFIGK